MIELNADIGAALMMRIRQLACRAVINTSDDTGNVQLVQVQSSQNEIYDSRPRVAEFGFTSNPPAGSDAVVLFFGGIRSNGVVIGTNNQTFRIKNLAPGETAVYDAFGKSIVLSHAGITVQANNMPVTVNGATTVTVNASAEIDLVSPIIKLEASTEIDLIAPTIKLTASVGVIADTPLLSTSGDIVDNSGSNSKTLADLRTAYDNHDHQVAEVQDGSSTITTSTPSPTV